MTCIANLLIAIVHYQARGMSSKRVMCLKDVSFAMYWNFILNLQITTVTQISFNLVQIVLQMFDPVDQQGEANAFGPFDHNSVAKRKARQDGFKQVFDAAGYCFLT